VTSARRRPPGPGALVLVVGPSGAGKDTLLELARARLAGNAEIVFARRRITRAREPDGEDHDVIDEQSYRRETAGGKALLHWRAHGLGYIIPATARRALSAGATVVCNVSRKVVAHARGEFAPVVVVLVTAPADVLAQRLVRRGRESEQQIADRLSRASIELPHLQDVMTVTNIGDPESGGEQLRAIIEIAHRRAP
jgi:ribose 1,5-bisphosphokinase